MILWFVRNELLFTNKGLDDCKEVILPTKLPIYSVCHRPKENLIVVALANLSDVGNNEDYNVYGVSDITGEIFWRIKPKQNEPLLTDVFHYFCELIELPDDSNLYVLDNLNMKWKIDLFSGEISNTGLYCNK